MQKWLSLICESYFNKSVTWNVQVDFPQDKILLGNVESLQAVMHGDSNFNGDKYCINSIAIENA